MRKILFLIIAACYGCVSSEPTKVDGQEYFNVSGLLEMLIQNSAVNDHFVNKTAQINGKMEMHKFDEVDSSFWRQELQMFFEADLNTPINQSRYNTFSDLSDSLSNLKLIRHSLYESDDTGVQWENIYYLDTLENVHKIEFERLEKNVLFFSKKSFFLWANRYHGQLLIDSIKISGVSKMITRDSVSFSISTRATY